MVDDTNYAWTEPTEGGAEGQYVGEHNQLVDDIKSVIRTIETAFDDHANTANAHHDPIVPGDGLVEDADGRVSVDEDVLAGGVTAGDGLSDDNGTFNVAPGEVGTEEFSTTAAEPGQILGDTGWRNPPKTSDTSNLNGYTGGGRDDLEIYPGYGPGIEFNEIYTLPVEPEGSLYHGGLLYIGVREHGSSRPIYVYDVDSGNQVDTIQPSGTQFDHCNNLFWLDDRNRILVGNADPTEGFVVDPSSNSPVEQQIDFEGALDPMQMRALVPDESGDMKVLFTEFDFSPIDRVAGAALVDLDGMLADGTTNGNVEVTFDADWFTRLQGSVWKRGWLYRFTHDNISKAYVGYADSLRSGGSLASQLDWFQLTPTDSTTIETGAYDPTTGFWYIPESDGRIFRGREGFSQKDINNWGTRSAEVRGVESHGAIQLDHDEESNSTDAWVFDATAREAVVDMWFYDSGYSSADFATYIAVVNNANGNRLVISPTEEHGGGDRYGLDTESGGTGTTDSGVTRPSGGGWVNYRFFPTSSTDTQLGISTDFGASWETFSGLAGGAERFNRIRLNTTGSTGYRGALGKVSIKLIRNVSA